MKKYDKAIYDFEVSGPGHQGLDKVIAAVAEQAVEELESGVAVAASVRILIVRPKEPGMAADYDPADDEDNDFLAHQEVADEDSD